MFGIDESVVANIFVTWIIFIYRQWNELKEVRNIEMPKAAPKSPFVIFKN